MERAALDRLRVIAIALLWSGCVLAQTSAERTIDDAAALMRSGDLAGAERLLRNQPGDAEALGLLAVVQDQEKKYVEAEDAYRRALKMAPRSAALLNNYGNHLLATGKGREAEALFLRVIAANPSHANARVQLARIALEQDRPKQALAYLEHVPPPALQAADVAMLRMQILYALHRDAEADVLLKGVQQAGDAATGRALLSARQYGKARPYLERALQQHPENADLLYELAVAQAGLHADEPALGLLARAANLAPERADIQKLLARVAGQLGFAGDALQAWSRYAALAPGDDEGRRERGFAQTALGGDTAPGIADLRWFVQRHPEDAVGHYELGTAIAASQAEEARVHLDRALFLKPELLAAHVARGILSYRQGNFAAALADFRFAAGHDPKNAAVQDRVGETYLALGQPRDALPWLQRAAGTAPDEPRFWLHLGRAFSRVGEADQADKAMARFRELGADRSTFSRPAGIVDFLNLSPGERLARYRAGVEKAVGDHPENVAAQVRYLGVLLDRRDWPRAEEVSRKIAALQPSPVLCVQAADALVAAEQFSPAIRFIQTVGGERALALDLSIALDNVEGPQRALPILESIPENERTGDYYLVSAIVLVGLSRAGEAHTRLARALELHPARPDLYRQGARMLLRAKEFNDAEAVLREAAERFPDMPEFVELQTELRTLSHR